MLEPAQSVGHPSPRRPARCPDRSAWALDIARLPSPRILKPWRTEANDLPGSAHDQENNAYIESLYVHFHGVRSVHAFLSAVQPAEMRRMVCEKPCTSNKGTARTTAAYRRQTRHYAASPRARLQYERHGWGRNVCSSANSAITAATICYLLRAGSSGLTIT